MAARIAVDAMGGDRAPEEVIAGALEAASPHIVPVLVGPSGLDTGGLELVEARTTIAMDEKPADAVRSKRDSSLVVACRLVREGLADEPAGDDERAVALGPDGIRWLLVHRDRRSRLDQFEAAGVEAGRPDENGNDMW